MSCKPDKQFRNGLLALAAISDFRNWPLASLRDAIILIRIQGCGVFATNDLRDFDQNFEAVAQGQPGWKIAGPAGAEPRLLGPGNGFQRAVNVFLVARTVEMAYGADRRYSWVGTSRFT